MVNKWIQKANIKKGALHRSLRIPQDKKISDSKLESIIKAMRKKEAKDKLTPSERKLLKRAYLAKTLKQLHK